MAEDHPDPDPPPPVDEVRTRRVVVCDEAGRPAIVLASRRGTASVEVRAPRSTALVELYATGPVEADGPEVGLALVVDGDVVASFLHLVPGEDPDVSP